MTPLSKEYKASKAPGALFAILLTLGVNAGLFSILGWVNHRPKAIPPPPPARLAHSVSLKKFKPVVDRKKQFKVKKQPSKQAKRATSRVKRSIRASRPMLNRPQASPQQVAVKLTLPEFELTPTLAEDLSETDQDLETGDTQLVGNDGIADETEVDTPPQPTYSPSPRYPFSARKLGYTGLVKLGLVITKDGKADNLEIRKSSGHHSLDNSALRTVRTWRFRPAEDQGEKVDVRGTVEINFQLEVK